jgi:hypothetical protein
MTEPIGIFGKRKVKVRKMVAYLLRKRRNPDEQ